jgi:DNA-binding MarR family transcriptional regulator
MAGRDFEAARRARGRREVVVKEARPRSSSRRTAASTPAGARDLSGLKGSKFATPTESSGFLLWQLSNAWHRRVRKELEAVGLTHAQFVLLAGIAWLSRSASDVTQVDLARHSKIDVMTTSQVLRALEARKLVFRAPHQHDARAKCLVLAPESHGLLKRALKLVEGIDASFFEVLGDDLDSFNEAMRLLIQSVEP